MLYSEFLLGTNAKDNLHTYSEYERINVIYNNNNSMDKTAAYKLYREPDELTSKLLQELEDARTQARDYANSLVTLRKAHAELVKERDKERRVRISLQATLQESAQKAHDLYYMLTD